MDLGMTKYGTEINLLPFLEKKNRTFFWLNEWNWFIWSRFFIKDDAFSWKILDNLVINEYSRYNK